MQSLIRAIYPPQCVACDAATEIEHGLCGACWRDTHFVRGLACDSCGAPLIGEGDSAEVLRCDDCMTVERPWDQGRTALVYKGVGRRLALSLKHGDRSDLKPAMASWMANAGKDVVQPETVVVPVPLHWSRLIKRKYNQAALLADGVARSLGLSNCLDALIRVRRTHSLDQKGRDARFALLDGAIQANPCRRTLLENKDVLIVDDVMTSGATLSSCTHACYAAGAKRVCVLTLARVLKDA